MNKFLTGVALGVVVGILLAPDKGAETRKKLSKKGKEMKKQFNDFVDTWSEKINSLRHEAEEIVEDTPPRAQSYPSQPYSV